MRDAGGGQARRVAVARPADQQRPAPVEEESAEPVARLLPAPAGRDRERHQPVEVVDVAEDPPRPRRALGAGRLGLQHGDPGAAVAGREGRRQPDHPRPHDQEVGGRSEVSARSWRCPGCG